MTNLIQARIDTYADTVDYGEKVASISLPGSRATPKACLVTVEEGKIIVYTLNMSDSALPLLNKTKITERTY
jgi:hypothetical protein